MTAPRYDLDALDRLVAEAEPRADHVLVDCAELRAVIADLRASRGTRSDGLVSDAAAVDVDAILAAARAAKAAAISGRWSVSEPFVRGGDGPARELVDVLAARRPRMAVAEDCLVEVAEHIAAACPDVVIELVERLRAAERGRAEALSYAATFSPFTRWAADALADEVAVLVRRRVIDARSPAADALLDYRNPPSSDRADRMAALEAENERIRARLAKVEQERDAVAGERAALSADVAAAAGGLPVPLDEMPPGSTLRRVVIAARIDELLGQLRAAGAGAQDLASRVGRWRIAAFRMWRSRADAAGSAIGGESCAP